MKRNLITVLALVTGVLVCLAVAGMADAAGVIQTSGVWPVNNHTYTIVLLPVASWADATADMNVLLPGHHLATVTSPGEQAFIDSLFIAANLSGEYWLGACQPPGVVPPWAGWSWVTGEAWGYTNWAPDEPNDAHGPASEQHLAMWSNFGWKWNDEAALGNMTGYVAESPLPVSIDIKPGSDPNAINPKSKGVIPVAILGSATFDVTTVDVTTLSFGPAGASPAHDLTDPDVLADHTEDVNGDGFMDLVSHYRVQETGIQPGDTKACLTGKTTSAQPIKGCDAIVTVPKQAPSQDSRGSSATWGKIKSR